MQDVFLIAGARTPVGVLQGVFSEVSAIDLGVIAAQGAIERSGVDPRLIDQVVTSGARLAITLTAELCRQNLKYGAASLCIGGGQGIAAIFENVNS